MQVNLVYDAVNAGKMDVILVTQQMAGLVIWLVVLKDDKRFFRLMMPLTMVSDKLLETPEIKVS